MLIALFIVSHWILRTDLGEDIHSQWGEGLVREREDFTWQNWDSNVDLFVLNVICMASWLYANIIDLVEQILLMLCKWFISLYILEIDTIVFILK